MHEREPLSQRNPEIARLRALGRDRTARHEAGRFVVEGTKLVADVLASDLPVLGLFADPGWVPGGAIQAALSARNLDITAVSERGIERIASTTTPQPVVAEVAIPERHWRDFRGRGAVLVAVDLSDPGNLGTLMRSAVAAGFDAVVALGDTADPFGPKVVRASAGALFRVPVLIDRDPIGGLARIGDTGIRRFGTRMDRAVACDEADLGGPIALVLGNEAHGLGSGLDESIDGWLTIPMPGGTESLNVAMAGAILTYEVARQRRLKPPA